MHNKQTKIHTNKVLNNNNAKKVKCTMNAIESTPRQHKNNWNREEEATIMPANSIRMTK